MTATIEQRSVEPSTTEPVGDKLAPHPTLGRYYRGPDEKRAFVRRIFDDSAGHYDQVERMMAFGSGPWYRRQALARAGLAPGMKCLDVAVGTGLVAREAVTLVGDPAAVTGLDPSPGMLAQAAKAVPIRLVVGRAEVLPFGDRSFDFLSMGYALRHVSDVAVTMREFLRVLRPGGRLCLLEITRPHRAVARALVKCYMKGVVPCLSRLTAGGRPQRLLWEYYWDTINACVPPAVLREAMTAAGFAGVKRHVELGIFSEYTGRKL
jgi:demethylmenaquinone methyltransferase / 2-methoxy-6-polyprenyl-1,4-benzoquinol methylase